MRITVFTNKTFYYLFVSYIIVLFSYNCYVSIAYKYLYGLSPILIQITLLAFIFSRSKYAKLLIQIWAIVFQIIAFGLQVLGGLITGLNNNFESFKWGSFVYLLIMLGIGITILSYTNRTVIVDFKYASLEPELPQENTLES